MNDVLLNGKFLMQRPTGVQRYALGLLPFLENVEVVKPSLNNSRRQLIWEHITLGKKAQREGKLLLNLCNTAPFWYKNQVVCMHDMAVFENPRWFNPVFARYYQRLFQALAKNARHFATVSEFSKLEMIKHLGIAEHKITVIHSAVSDEFKQLASTVPSQKPEKPFLLMVGSHDPRKNFQWVIDQIKDWLAANNHELLIIGNPGKAFAQQAISQLKNIRWLTDISDSTLKWYYENTALLIHPAVYEGFSLVPLEAGACGAKMLISDIPVHREVNGAMAEYFPIDSSKSLIKHLECAVTGSFSDSSSYLYSFEKSGQLLNEILHRLKSSHFHNIAAR